MKRCLRTWLIAGVVWCVASTPMVLHAADSPRSLNARGNELYAAGEYDQALAAYEQAGTEEPESAEIWFNKGNAYLQKGDYGKAREAYENAVLRTRDLSLESKAQFNMGNGAFLEAQKQLSVDAKKALPLFETSIHHYREALRLDPQLGEAARNLEVTRIRLKDTLDRIRKQEEEAKERQARQEDMLKQLREVIAEQELELKTNGKLQEEKGSRTEQEFLNSVEQLAGDQARTEEKTGEAARKLRTIPSGGQPPQGAAGQQDPKTAAGEDLDRAREEQKAAVGSLEGRDLDGAGKHQEEALSQLRAALEKLTGSQTCNQPGSKEKEEDGQQQESKKEDQKSGQSGDQKESASSEGGDEQTPRKEKKDSPSDQASSKTGEEQGAQAQQGKKADDEKSGDAQKARSMVMEKPEDVLREEKENRLRFERSHGGGYRPVEKDW